MKRASINYCGVPMVCDYEYDPAEPSTYLYPGAPENAALVSCRVGGVDVLEMLTNEQQDEIEVLILEAHGEQDAADAAEAYAMRRDERAMEGFLA